MPVHKYESKSAKTKRQRLSELGLTEDEIVNIMGFHWESLSLAQLRRGISYRQQLERAANGGGTE